MQYAYFQAFYFRTSLATFAFIYNPFLNMQLSNYQEYKNVFLNQDLLQENTLLDFIKTHLSEESFSHWAKCLERLFLHTDFQQLTDTDKKILISSLLCKSLYQHQKPTISIYAFVNLCMEYVDAPFAERNRVAELLRFEDVPQVFMQKNDPVKIVVEASICAQNNLLALLCAAQNSSLQTEIVLETYKDHCHEYGCWDKKRQFSSEHSRFMYFRNKKVYPYSKFPDDTQKEVLVLCGLPEINASEWLEMHKKEHLQVQADTLLIEAEMPFSDMYKKNYIEEKESAKNLMRISTPFAWNSTNLTKKMRREIIDMFSAQRAKIHFIYFDAPLYFSLQNNQKRRIPLSQEAIQTVFLRTEIPNLTEAHRLTIVERNQII